MFEFGTKKCTAPVISGAVLCRFCASFCLPIEGLTHADISQELLFGDGF
jgi:hypothetical protein